MCLQVYVLGAEAGKAAAVAAIREMQQDIGANRCVKGSDLL